MKLRLLIILVLLIGTYVNSDESNLLPITVENAQNIELIYQYGEGTPTGTSAWSPDGTQVAMGGTRGVWVYNTDDLNSAPNFHNIEGGSIEYLFFAAANRLLTGTDTNTILYSLESRAVIAQLPGRVIGIDDRGERAAIQLADVIHIIDTETGTTQVELSYSEDPRWRNESPAEDGYTYRSHVDRFQFAPNDTRALVTWRTIGTTGFDAWNEHVATDVWDLQHPDQGYEALTTVFNDDIANDAVSGFDETGAILAVDNGTMYRANAALLSLDDNPWTSPAPFYTWQWNIHSNLIALDQGASSEVWDVFTGERIAILPATGELHLSPNGRLLIIGSMIYDITTGEELLSPRFDSYTAVGMPDRALRLQTDGNIELIDPMSGTIISNIPMSITPSNEENRYSFQAGLLKIESGSGERILLIDPTSGEVQVDLTADTNEFRYSRLSAGGHYLRANMGYNEQDPIWDVETGVLINPPEGLWQLPPLFTPNELILYLDPHTETLILFDPSTGTEHITVPLNEEMSLRLRNDAVNVYDNDYSVKGYVTADGQTYYLLLAQILFQIDLVSGAVQSVAGICDFTINPTEHYLVFSPFFDFTVTVMELPELTEVHKIETEVITCADVMDGYGVDMHFVDDTALQFSPSGLDFYFDVELGEPIAEPRPEPIAYFDGLAIYRSSTGVSIEDAAGNLLIDLPTGNVLRATINTERTIIMTEGRDGNVMVWGIPSE